MKARKHPAHHSPHARHNEPVIVQVNVCTNDRKPLLAFDAMHHLLRETWQQSDFWRVGTYMIMPDHIHLFCMPGRIPATSLRQWVAYWKSRVASNWPFAIDGAESVGTEPDPPKTKLWQRDFWDTQMRSRRHYEEKLSYVRMNPVRKGLVEHASAWPYQGQVFPLAWM